VAFIDNVYGMESFGYKESSRWELDKHHAAIKSMDDAKGYLLTRPGLGRFFINTGGIFRRQQMEEQLNLSREEAQVIIQRLSNMGMIQSMNANDYKIMPLMNGLLREIKEYQ
jgi:hypothetical protein